MKKDDVQEIERKKRYLKRYKKNLECITRLEERLSLLDARITSIRSVVITGMPRGGKPVTTADLIADKCQLEQRLSRLREKSSRLRRETLQQIDRTNDSRYMEVLEKTFIDCLSLDDAADTLGYGRRHVQRLYSEALKALVEQQ